MDHHLVTTTSELPGRRVMASLGLVRGIIVRSRSAGASIQQVSGGNVSLLTSMCEQARNDAYELMIRHAEQLGADGIIGVRYDATGIAEGLTEVLCYGTAVTLEPAERG